MLNFFSWNLNTFTQYKEGVCFLFSFYLQYVEKITTILTNPSFLLKFSTTRFRHVSAYYQFMFNTDEQFLFYNFMMTLERNKGEIVN